MLRPQMMLDTQNIFIADIRQLACEVELITGMPAANTWDRLRFGDKCSVYHNRDLSQVCQWHMRTKLKGLTSNKI